MVLDLAAQILLLPAVPAVAALAITRQLTRAVQAHLDRAMLAAAVLVRRVI
jgi:hypothetical protein